MSAVIPRPAFLRAIEREGQSNLLRTVAPDRFDWAGRKRFFRKLYFFVGLGLFKNIRVTTIFIPLEVRRGGFAAQITVDALIIDVESAFSVLRIAVFLVGHEVVEVRCGREGTLGGLPSGAMFSSAGVPQPGSPCQ